MSTLLSILVSLALAFCGCALPETCENVNVYTMSDLHAIVDGESLEGLPEAEFRIGLSRGEARAELSVLDGETNYLPLAIDVAGSEVRFALGSENYYSIDSKLLTELVTGGNAEDDIAVSERMLADLIDLITEFKTSGPEIVLQSFDLPALGEIFGVESTESFVTVNDEEIPSTETTFSVTIGSLVDLLDLCENQGGAFAPVAADILELAGGPALGINSFADLKALLPESSAAIGVEGVLITAEDSNYFSLTLMYNSESDGTSVYFAVEENDGEFMLSGDFAENASAPLNSFLLLVSPDETFRLYFEQTEGEDSNITLDADGTYALEEGALNALSLTGSYEMPCVSMRYEAGEEGSYAYVTDALYADFGYDVVVSDGLADVTYTANVRSDTITENFNENSEAVGEAETVSTEVSEVETITQRLEDDGTIATDLEIAISTPENEISFGCTLTERVETAGELFEGMTEYVFSAEAGDDETMTALGSNDETMTALAGDVETLLGNIEALTELFTPAAEEEVEEETIEEEIVEEEAEEAIDVGDEI